MLEPPSKITQSLKTQAQFIIYLIVQQFFASAISDLPKSNQNRNYNSDSRNSFMSKRSFSKIKKPKQNKADKKEAVNTSMDFQPYSQDNLSQDMQGTSGGQLNQMYQSQDILNLQQFNENDNGNLFPTEVDVGDQNLQIDQINSPKSIVRKPYLKKKRVIALNQSATINGNIQTSLFSQANQTQSLSPFKIYGNNSQIGNSKYLQCDALSRYMRARDLAEQKAKEKIDRLNTLIEKWDKKDKKAKEIILENLLEKRYKLEEHNRKLEQARMKYERSIKDIEDKGIQEYNLYLAELREKKIRDQNKLNIESEKDYIKLQKIQHSQIKRDANNNSTNITIQEIYQIGEYNTNKDSNTKIKRRLSETGLQLQRLENKILAGRERSLMIKKDLSKKSERDLNKSPEIQHQIEIETVEKLSKYLEKRKKHDKLMTQKNEELKYWQESQKQKLQQKLIMFQQAKQEYEDMLNLKRSQILQSQESKDESLSHLRQESEIQQIRRIEQSKLKRQDLKEMYEEVQEIQKEKKEKIMQKHLNINKNLMNLRKNEKIANEMRIRQHEERRRFLEQKSHSNPYEEMKWKFLKSSVDGSSKKNKGANSQIEFEENEQNQNN